MAARWAGSSTFFFDSEEVTASVSFSPSTATGRTSLITAPSRPFSLRTRSTTAGQNLYIDSRSLGTRAIASAGTTGGSCWGAGGGVAAVAMAADGAVASGMRVAELAGGVGESFTSDSDGRPLL